MNNLKESQHITFKNICLWIYYAYLHAPQLRSARYFKIVCLWYRKKVVMQGSVWYSKKNRGCLICEWVHGTGKPCLWHSKECVFWYRKDCSWYSEKECVWDAGKNVIILQRVCLWYRKDFVLIRKVCFEWIKKCFAYNSIDSVYVIQ